MIELLTGAALSLISLLLGYSLGKHNSPIPKDFTKELKEVCRRVVPNNELGAIPIPTPREKELYDNPNEETEQRVMSEELDDLNKVL